MVALNFEEFESMVNQVIYVSATPGDYELEQTEIGRTGNQTNRIGGSSNRSETFNQPD
jgi:excinuclease UvrABC helicase subunit UvrB